MKKLVSAFLLLVLLSLVFVVPLSVQAHGNSTVYGFEIALFASLVDDGENAINPQTVEVLYDLNGNPSFLVAGVIPHGFAIMFRDAIAISEKITTEGVTNPFASARGRKIYAGPMMYIDYYNGVYINLLREQEIGGNHIQSMSMITESVLSNLPEPSLIQPLFTPAGGRWITHHSFIRNAGFGENVHGTCGPIAASIILVHFEMMERMNGRTRYRVVPENLFPPHGE